MKRAETVAARGLKEIVWWGTYDKGKPRTRILLRGLRESGVDVMECHRDVWGAIADKSQVKAGWTRVCLLVRWLSAYPALVLRYLLLPPHDVVMVGYLGHLDVLVLWPFARLRGARIAWDAFLSLYDTVVEDRALVGHRNPLAWLLYAWDWLAGRAADIVVLDTAAHGRYFVERFNLQPEKVRRVFVGAETELFAPIGPEGALGRQPTVRSASRESPRPSRERDQLGWRTERLPGQPSTSDGSSDRHPGPAMNSDHGVATILFYGQFIPLHGIETIVRAARLSQGKPWRWILIGRGQEEERIGDELRRHPLDNLEWIPWVRYEDLALWIRRADVCLGIFGDGAKAGRVIPNKVFQIIAAGKPLVTRDSPAIRELVSADEPGIRLVPPADPHALVCAVEALVADPSVGGSEQHGQLLRKITPRAIGANLAEIVESGWAGA